MSLPKDEAWFPVKQCGYGWGVPRRWQGVLTLMIYFLGLFASILLLGSHRGYLFAVIALWTLGLWLVCAWKGEAARWRWGDDE